MIKSAKDILAAIGDDEPVRGPGRPREYDPVCGREGCERPHHAHGLCSPCVRRFVYKTNTRRNKPWLQNHAAKASPAA